MSSDVDWTAVIVSSVSIIPASLAAVFAYLSRRHMKMPSGGTLGEVVERTHHLAAVTVAQNTAMLKANGTNEPSAGDVQDAGGE